MIAFPKFLENLRKKREKDDKSNQKKKLNRINSAGHPRNFN